MDSGYRAGAVSRACLLTVVETVKGKAEESQCGSHEIGLQRLQRNKARTPGAADPQHHQQERSGTARGRADRRSNACEN